MDELLVLNTTTEVPTISARDLHQSLEINTKFNDWIARIIEYGFLEGTDFYSNMSESTGGRPSTEYMLTVDMAKEICMLQRTDKGRECRQYFIVLEKAWNTPEQVMSRALRIADKTINRLTSTIADMKPKADFFDAVADSKTAIPMDQVAKVLDCGLGRNKIFELLRNNSILQYNNIPYQKYVDLGYFRVVEQSYVKPTGENCVNTKTLVFQRGLDFIRKQIKKGE